MHRLQAQSRAFTIIELVFVLAVLSLLISLVLPVLASVRRHANDAVALAAMHQVQIGLVGYCDDHSQSLPYFATPGNPEATIYLHGANLDDAQGGYFRIQSTYWASLVLPYFSGWPTLSDSPLFLPVGDRFGLPAARATDVVFCRFWLTHTAFAAPEYWDTDTTPADRSLYRGTRLSQIRQPSRKGLLLDVGGASFNASQRDRRNRDDVFVGMADGAVCPFPWHPQADFVVRPYSATQFPTMSTKGGLASTDF